MDLPAPRLPSHRERANESVAPFLNAPLAHGLVPLAAAVAISSGALLNAYDGVMGQALAAIAGALLLGFLLLIEPPAIARWRAVAPALACLGAAMLWLTIAGPVADQLGWRPALARPSPDLFEPKVLGLSGALAALLAGWLVAQRPQRVALTIDLLLVLNTGFLMLGFIIRAYQGTGSLDFWTPDWRGRFAGTAGNANVTATLCGVVILLAVTRLLTVLAQTRSDRLQTSQGAAAMLACTALLVASAAAIATASRFAITATFLLGAALLMLAMRRHPNQLRRHAWVLGAAAVACLVVMLASVGALLQRFDDLSREGDLRLAMWSHYTALALDSPWIGYGHGSFAALNQARLEGIAMAEKLWSVNSAHQLVLQLILAAGLPYLLLMTAAAALIVRQIITGGRWGVQESGIAAAIALIAASAMVDIILDVPATAMLMAFLAGILWSRSANRYELRIG